MTFEGEIGEIDLIQRLVELGGETFTGALRFESDGIIKIVYFKGGDILSASTNDRTDAIDEILQRANKVTREHVKQAVAKRKESETLGDALLGLGFITRKELTWARRVQVIGILRSILGWKTGSYTIVADYLPKREEGTIYPLSQIIVELVVTDTDRSKSEQAMESGNAVFEKAANFDDAFRRLGLNEDAEQIVAQIDGSNSAADVASRSGKDVFNVYKLLEALRLLGLVTRAGKPPATHEVSMPSWDVVENPDFTLDDVAPAAAASAAPVDHWAPELDSSTMEIPAWTPAAPEPEVKPAAHSVWDDPTDDDSFSGTELAPPPIAPAVEPQWGFDEAQIEAARRAAVPVHANEEVPTSRPPTADAKPRRSLLLPLLVSLLVAVGAYGGWMWWQSRQAPEAVVMMPRHTPPKLRNAGVPPAGTAASTPPAVTTNTITTAAPATTTITPISAAPAPQTTTSAAIVSKPVPATASVAKPAPIKPPVSKPTPVTTTVAPRLDRTAGGAMITNVPQNTTAVPKTTTALPKTTTPAATSDPVRLKYDGMARDFAAQTGGSHTLQFELVCETSSITRAIAEAGDKVWFVTTSYKGRPCYRVFWGRFNSSAEATAGASQFPAALGVKPVVVKIPR